MARGSELIMSGFMQLLARDLLTGKEESEMVRFSVVGDGKREPMPELVYIAAGEPERKLARLTSQVREYFPEPDLVQVQHCFDIYTEWELERRQETEEEI